MRRLEAIQNPFRRLFRRRRYPNYSLEYESSCQKTKGWLSWTKRIADYGVNF